MDPVFAGLAAAVIVLQIITLVVVFKIRSLVTRTQESEILPIRRPTEKPAEPKVNAPMHRRRDATPPPRRPEAPAPAQSAGQIDRTLRDINLRLKSAERDQERVRREMRSPQATQQQEGRRNEPFQRRADRDRFRNQDGRNARSLGQGSKPYSARPEGQRFGNHRSDAHGHRSEPSKAQGQDESPAPSMGPASLPAAASAAQPASQAAAPMAQEKPDAVSPIADINVSAVANIEPSGSAYAAEEIEHGRRFAVKRRPIESQSPTQAGPPPNAASPASSQPAMQEAESAGSEVPTGELVYGRR